MSLPAAMPDNVRPLFRGAEEMSDGALVQAARSGQAWAKEALFKRHARLALGKAWRLIPGEDPEDLAQDALVHALTHLDELGQPQAFVAWLSTIVVRLAMTRLRKRHLLTRLGLRHAEQIDPDELTSGLSADARVALHDAYAVLAELAPEERVALVLRRVEGLELQEIATHMKLSLATVKRRLSAAEARIQALHEGGAR